MLNIIIRSCGILFLAFTGLIVLAGVAGSGRDGDALFYTTRYIPTPVVAYDPQTMVQVEVTPPLSVEIFHVSINGHLAVWASDGIYVWHGKGLPVNIGSNLQLHNYTGAWSHDGRYLVLSSSFHHAGAGLYVWDETSLLNVTPDALREVANRYETVWSFDGRLAFSVHYSVTGHPYSVSDVYIWDGQQTTKVSQDTLGYKRHLAWSYDGRLAFVGLPSLTDVPPEVYIWDGYQITNISQNPAGDDHSPVWSDDGRLAFFSQREGEYGIAVWEHDMTFIPVSVYENHYISEPQWINSGHLLFVRQTAENEKLQIYLWDGQTITNISGNKSYDYYAPTWSADGLLAWVDEGSIYIGDADQRILFTHEGFRPVWNPNGYLAFCQHDQYGRFFARVWDRRQVITPVDDTDFWGQWQSGEAIGCGIG
jgi:hypothetical protein